LSPLHNFSGQKKAFEADISAVAWLIEEGYDVVCFMAAIGQEEDFKATREKALKIGAKECYL
jgi:argininosuccinate synthase